MGYKLIQIGYATFGAGETPEDARNDAREWLDNETDAGKVAVFETIGHARTAAHGALAIVPDDVADELGDY